MSITGLLSLFFALASVLLLVLYALQRRELRALHGLTQQVQRIAIGGRLTSRIDLATDHPDLGALVTAVNHLLARASTHDGKGGGAPELFADVGDRVHEIVLIHGESILYANPQFAMLMGVDRKAIVGRRLPEFVPADHAGLVAENLRKRLAGEDAPERYEIDVIGQQGQLTRLEIATASTTFENAPALLITGVEVIPTQSVPALRLPMSSDNDRSRARAALDCLTEAVLTTDFVGNIDYANPAAGVLLGVDAADLGGRRLDEVVTLVDDTDRKLLADPVQQVIASGAPIAAGQRALLLTRNSGGEQWIELSVAPLRSRDNGTEEITGSVLLLHDVTEQRGYTQKMSYQATHDALTGLINRREFERRLGESLEGAHRGDGTHVLCFLDLDRFKAVNDTSGHLAGDSMLREVAKLMREAVRDSDSVGRLGGDEFGLLLVGCPLEKARQIADDLARRVADFRFVWKDRVYHIGASIGLIELARDSGTLEEALAAADSACYVAKRQGGHVAVYSARDEMVARHSGEIQWLQMLQNAIRRNRFELYAQPIIAAYGDNGRGPSMEVLLRLKDDLGRDITPNEFVHAAERYRLIGLVDRWVVQTTLTALGRGAIELSGDRSLALNVSGQTIADPQFLEFVVDCLDRTGATPAQVCFEIAESAVVANIDQARRFVGVLHGMGCQFALDNFGSNLGSFANLKNLPIDYLKIDGSFIRNLPRDSVNQAMVAAMIKLARTLNFKVIAEHCEDVAVMDTARSMGIDYLQGYAVGRPAPLKLAA